MSFSVTEDQFILAYYLPFLRAIEMGDHIEAQSPFTTASFEQQELRVSMPNALVERIRRAEAGELAGLFEDMLGLLADTTSIGDRVFRDGVTIATAWNEALSLPDWDQPGETFTFG